MHDMLVSMSMLLNFKMLQHTTFPTKDCIEHMGAGRKMDATFIMEKFKEKVAEVDEIFFFDGASHVQTGGEILCATFQRAMCFHGGKHVLSLFSWIYPILNQSRSVNFEIFTVLC